MKYICTVCKDEHGGDSPCWVMTDSAEMEHGDLCVINGEFKTADFRLDLG